MDRAMPAFTAALILLASPAAFAQSSGDDAYCAALKEVVSHTKNDFASFKAKAISGTEWAPKLALPGQQRCSIQQTAKRIAYVCESTRLSDYSQASDASAASMKRAQECLGKQWNPQTALSEFFTSISDVEKEQSIIFSVDRDSPFPQYMVVMQIMRMFQQPLEADPKSAAELSPVGYCADLAKVIRSGKTSFSEIIEGTELNKVGLRLHWLSNTQLNGWKDCYVHGDEGKPQCRYMSCSVGPMTNRAEAEKLRDKLASEVKACLGAGWKTGRTRRTDGIVDIRVIGGAADPYVELHPGKSLYSDAWNLHLAVQLDQCK